MNVQRLRQSITSHWDSIAWYGGLFGVLGAALIWKLNTLVPGYGQPEVDTYNASQSVHNILDNPLNAPFLLLVRALSFIHPDSYVVTRIAAVMIGLAVLVMFAIILRNWHDRRTTLIGTLLFGLSAWFLHAARLGTPDILMFGVFALVVCSFWLKHTNNWPALVVSFLAAAGLLYVPGMVWFIVLGFVWQWKVIERIFKRHLLTITLSGLAFVAAIVPLVWAFYKDHSLIKPWLGLPPGWTSPVDMIQNVLAVPFHLFVRNGADPLRWLGTAPILDVFALVMFVLGGYLYLRHYKLARTPIFIGVMAVTGGLMVIGTTITFSVIMPFIYLVVAAGISHLLNLWFGVFPRNPIARTIGWSLVGIALALACSFHLVHYFVGWPQASATHEVFKAQKP